MLDQNVVHLYAHLCRNRNVARQSRIDPLIFQSYPPPWLETIIKDAKISNPCPKNADISSACLEAAFTASASISFNSPKKWTASRRRLSIPGFYYLFFLSIGCRYRQQQSPKIDPSCDWGFGGTVSEGQSMEDIHWSMVKSLILSEICRDISCWAFKMARTTSPTFLLSII